MALNSLIRKIDLKANCDLSSYRMDVHNYEGFAETNSLFFNKRLHSWFTRGSSSDEGVAGLKFVAEGYYFKVYRGTVTASNYIGMVSRYYTKLEDWDGNVTNPVIVKNPFLAGGEAKYFQPGAGALKDRTIGEVSDHYVRKLSNGYYTDTHYYPGGWQTVLYDNNGESVYNFLSQFKDGFPYYASQDETFFIDISQEWTYPEEESSSRPTCKVRGTVALRLNANDILFVSANGKEARIYNINTGRTRYDALTVAVDLTRYATYSGESDIQRSYTLTSRNKDELARLKSEVEIFLERSMYGADRTIKGLFSVGIQVFNGSVFIRGSVKGEVFGEWNNLLSDTGRIQTKRNSEITKDTSALLGNENPLLYLTENGRELKTGAEKITLTIEQEPTPGYEQSIFLYKEEFSTTVTNYSFLVEAHNYSVKAGDFAINYVNNVPESIGYKYHKLMYLEGKEENGVAVEIKQVETNTIYFQKGSQYYKIRRAYANDWQEMCVNVGNIYLVFLTEGYLNALYIPGVRWFCSCDDWNNRIIWRVQNENILYTLQNSRIGQHWQNANYPETVSAQYGSIPTRCVAAGLNVSPYASSATWDGESYVYDENGQVVDTYGWSYGHSLDGYYYPVSYSVDVGSMTPCFWDDYTAPPESGINYTVFMANMAGGSLGALTKVGYMNYGGFVADTGAEAFVDPQPTYYQDNPPLLGTTYTVFTSTSIVNIDSVSYYLMQNVNMSNIVLLYQTNDIASISESDKQFVINGSVYTYRHQAQRIVDSNNRWVCDTHLFHYIGFSSHYAYFYCDFDKALYAFNGDNTMTRLATIEKYTLRYSTDGANSQVDALNIPSIDLVVLNLGVAAGVIYGDQVAIIQTGNITSWSIDNNRGFIKINGVYYSLIYENVAANYSGIVNTLPVNIETEFYGDSEGETNVINDCVYLTLANIANQNSGKLKIKAVVLQNGKTKETEEKEFFLKPEDFDNNMTLIKYQPAMQEAKGFKLKISSDFEIAELKIGTSQGALNQTTKRI